MESSRCDMVCLWYGVAWYGVIWCGMAWRSAERGHYVHEAALENLGILRTAGGRGSEEERGHERGRSTCGLNKRLNIPSINFKRCKISANSMVGGGCHSFLSGWLPLSLPSAPYPALRPAGNPESSLKLRGIIGSAVSPGGSARSRNDGSLFIVLGRRADSTS